MRAIFYTVLAVFVVIGSGVDQVVEGLHAHSTAGTFLHIGMGLTLLTAGIAFVVLTGYRIMKNQALPATRGKHARRSF